MKGKKKMEKHYRTSDLSIASFLLASGDVTLTGTESESRQIFFLFAPKNRAGELIRLYWADQAPSIQPRQLFQSLRSVKDIIFGTVHDKS